VPIPSPELRSALTGKLEFEPSGSGGGPHEKYVLKRGGTYLAHTQIPHGRADVGDTLLAMIARQLGVTRRELYGVVDCTMDQDSYVRRLEHPPG
jgi:hypothetical protein